jgi:NAD-dependent deacetylase
MKKMVVLTGAGISAESGINTFRDADGLWEGHNVMEVATPEGFAKNPKLVLDFYNQRRKQLLEVIPNKAHRNLVALETDFDVEIITQNVDDLHERAGSSKITHLHGELLKVRSSVDEHLILDWPKDLFLGNMCAKKSQLRPHIVWFGEMVPMLDKAIEVVQKADILIIIGTSMQVYPAASLINYSSFAPPKNVRTLRFRFFFE